MKRKTISAVIAPATVVLMTTFSTAAALGANDINDDQWEKNRQTAEEYWTNFKQDSEQAWDGTREAFRDGWVEGKLHTALMLNENLSVFDIDIEVDSATATLRGEVDSDIDKELAANIALAIDGIDKVQNKITLNAALAREEDEGRGFAQYLADLSTTAAVKTELLASDNIKGLDINVDTYRDVVTLKGKVESSAQKDLAEAIVAKRDDVDKIENQLRVQ